MPRRRPRDREAVRPRRQSLYLRRVPVALVVLLLAGIALRVLITLAWSPAILNNWDSQIYIERANLFLFADPARPAGYPIFLKVVGWFSSDLSAVVVLQHVLGIASAILLYLTVRRLGGPVWAACVPAAVVLLSGDQLYVEHAILTEAGFTFCLVGAVTAVAYSLDAPGVRERLIGSREFWLVIAGGLLGLASWARPVGLPLAIALGLWIVFAFGGRWQARVGRAILTIGTAVAVVAVYMGAHAIKEGDFAITKMGGWALYARTAQFADCSKFTPPAGTARLCEQIPSEQRNGPEFYGWEASSPARKVFGAPPRGDAQLGAFGRTAILNQPFAFGETVFNDLIRYLAPSYNADRPWQGSGPEALDIARRAPGVEASLIAAINRFYSDESLESSGLAVALSDYQQIFRFHGILLLQCLILALVGVIFCRGRQRLALMLLLGAAVLLVATPIAYVARYAVPPAGLFAAAAALAGAFLIDRPQRRKSRSLPADEATDHHERAWLPGSPNATDSEPQRNRVG